MARFRRKRESGVAAGRRATPTLEERLAAITALRSSSAPIAVDQLPVVQGLANLHADVIAQFPLYACTQDGVRILDTPQILVQPDPTESCAETVHKIVQSLWYTGNAFALRNRDAIRVENPSAVGLIPSTDIYDDLKVDGWLVHGVTTPVDRIAWWKINDDPRHGPLGASPLARCWQAVENYAWAYRYLADYYRSGGNPSILLKDRNASDPAQADALWALWVAARQAGRPAVIPYDVDVAAAPTPTDIADTVSVLSFCTAEICRATNTPPTLGNAPVSASLTYATTLDELRRWLVLSLGPTWLARIERGFTALLPDGLFARFDTTELPRLDVFGDSPAAPYAPATTPAPPGPPRLEIVA
jgi:hypothetical protein